VTLTKVKIPRKLNENISIDIKFQLDLQAYMYIKLENICHRWIILYLQINFFIPWFIPELAMSF